MPKNLNSYLAKLNSYVIEFGKNIVQTDGKVICCTKIKWFKRTERNMLFSLIVHLIEFYYLKRLFTEYF